LTKYHSTPTTVDGIRFHSKKEAAYYLHLKLLKAEGKIKYFLRQTVFHLPGNVRYAVDFMVVDNDGSVEFIDVKGFLNSHTKNKIKITEALYPIKIKLV